LHIGPTTDLVVLLQLVACKTGWVPKSSSCQAEMRSNELFFDNTFAMDINAVNMKQYSWARVRLRYRSPKLQHS